MPTQSGKDLIAGNAMLIFNRTANARLPLQRPPDCVPESLMRFAMARAHPPGHADRVHQRASYALAHGVGSGVGSNVSGSMRNAAPLQAYQRWRHRFPHSVEGVYRRGAEEG